MMMMVMMMMMKGSEGLSVSSMRPGRRGDAALKKLSKKAKAMFDCWMMSCRRVKEVVGENFRDFGILCELEICLLKGGSVLRSVWG